MSALRDALQAARKALDNVGLQDGYIDYDGVDRAKALADAVLAATAPDNEAAFDKLLEAPRCAHDFVPYHPLGMNLDYRCRHCGLLRSVAPK